MGINEAVDILNRMKHRKRNDWRAMGGAVHSTNPTDGLRRGSADIDASDALIIAQWYAAKAEGTWQPIESAPKDGTQVWGWTNDRGSNPMMFISDPHYGSTQGIWVITYDDTEIDPTHWQPLPEPPKEQHGSRQSETKARQG